MKMYRLMGYMLVLLALMLAACGGNGDSDDDAPPDVQELLSEAATNINEADSFRFELRQSGAPTYFVFEGFEDLEITLNSATAVFKSPNSVRADISVDIGTTQKIAVIVVEDRQYYNHALLTGNEWLGEDLVPGFEPADLLSPESGIGAALLSVRDATLVGTEEIEGVPVYHVRGIVDAELARAVTFDLMSTATGDIQIDAYIRREGTRRLARLELVEPSAADAETDRSKIWEIDFAGYNQDVNITEPTVEAS